MLKNLILRYLKRYFKKDKVFDGVLPNPQK